MKQRYTSYTFLLFSILFVTLSCELIMIDKPSQNQIASKRDLVATLGLPDLALFSHQTRHRSLDDKFSQNSLDIALLSQDRALFVISHGEKR